jgi:hypothetical protein
MLARDLRGGTSEARLRRPQRVVTSAEHVWIIRESNATLAPNAPSDHCLVCESALTVRCAWEYPSEWAHLPDMELLQLFG